MSHSITRSQRRAAQRAAQEDRPFGIAVPLVLVISAFAASCGMASNTPLPDLGDTVSCTLESGRTVSGRVEDQSPGSAQIGAIWVNWDRVETWHVVE